MKISTSILNSTNKLDSIEKLNNTKTNYIHIDIMDGIFVPNTAFNNMNELEKISKISKKKLDIHLMVENPIEYIEKFNLNNIEYITFHLELNKDINRIIEKIKEKGYKVGISLKPNTEIKKIIPYINYIDLILIMSVEPGRGGQQFIETTISKIIRMKEILNKIENPPLIEVDGGINNKTIKLIKNNIDIAVIGSYITKSDNYNDKINTLL